MSYCHLEISARLLAPQRAVEVLVEAAGVELEAICRRERSRGSRRARFSRDGVEKREPAAEILSEAKDLSQLDNRN